MDLVEKIKILKIKKKAVILAHYYTLPEVQEIADCLGDSLALAQYARQTEAESIVFAGVHFMAETAKILNPDKRVLIPDFASHCSLADTCDVAEFRVFKEKHPDYKVISYINCSSGIKALSDVICTSGNAEKIVKSFAEDEKIIFAPDKNLGNYLNHKLGRNMLLWNGACHVHNRLQVADYLKIKEKYPESVFIAHPECPPELVDLATFAGSTTALIGFVSETDYPLYVIATENGILHEMKKKFPEKRLMILEGSCGCQCDYMKLNTLEKIYDCLENGSNEIFMDSEKMEAARKPILKMLSLS